MVAESGTAGAAYKPSALGAHTGSFFLFSYSVMIYTQFPPLMGCIWRGILFGLTRLPIPSSSWVPLALLECGIFLAWEELCDLTATSWLIKARKWSAQNTWIASPFQHQPVSSVGWRLPEMSSTLVLYHTKMKNTEQIAGWFLTLFSVRISHDGLIVIKQLTSCVMLKPSVFECKNVLI